MKLRTVFYGELSVVLKVKLEMQLYDRCDL